MGAVFPHEGVSPFDIIRFYLQNLILKIALSLEPSRSRGVLGGAIPPLEGYCFISHDNLVIFFNQSNDYTYFFTFVINICEKIITIIKFYLFVITRRKVLTVLITISSSLLVEAIGMTQGCLYQRRFPLI